MVEVRRQILLILAGLSLAGLASWIVYDGMLSEAKAAKTIIVAARDIAPGHSIVASDLAGVVWGSGEVPAGSYETQRELIGRLPINPIPARRPIFAGDLTPKGTFAGLQAVIAVGSRAVSLDAGTVSGMGAYIRQGSFVDVIVAGRDGANQPFSKIVVQRVRVLSAETSSDNDDGSVKPDSVTLQLDPSQAERLDLARSIGKLSIVLRNQFDDLAVTSKGARMPDLMTGISIAPQQAAVSAAAMPAAPSPPRRRQSSSNDMAVEEIRGTGERVKN